MFEDPLKQKQNTVAISENSNLFLKQVIKLWVHLIILNKVKY